MKCVKIFVRYVKKSKLYKCMVDTSLYMELYNIC